MSKNHKVIVGLSGGVDSAVAALLLKQQGREVQAVFMRNWEAEQEDPYCTIDADLQDAREVSEKLDIPISTVNFSREYWQRVFQHFLDEYAAGNTPNPDILCNKEIKFKAFLEHAINQGADYIATGHYVRKDFYNGKYRLLRGLDLNKDQSYFLHTLNQQQLAYSLFPVGELNKAQVRKLAETAGFPNHAKKDSTGICFIGERKFSKFLKEYLLPQPGPIVTASGQIIGKHDGLMFYTLGQRKGLGVGGRQDSTEQPWYVVKKDVANNQLIVAQQHDHPLLLSNDLRYKNATWIAGSEPQFPLACSAQIRYRQQAQKCIVTKDKVKFEVPQRAITPGQSVVFYQDEVVCVGGGVIV